MIPFRLVTVEPATSLYAGGVVAAARQIVRTPGMEATLEQARAAAARELPIPPDLRTVYQGQLERSHGFVESNDFGMMQTYAGATVPLIRQDWVKTVEIPAPAHELVPDLLS